jgi:hypothetical protein
MENLQERHHPIPDGAVLSKVYCCWCGIIGNLLIEPYVFEERLTSERYLRFLEDELSVLLEDVPLHIRRELWLQHDGTPPYFSGQVTVFLNQHFQNRWIGLQGSVAWPPRSPDLAPLDYYLWRRMKSLLCAVKSRTRSELLNRIMDAFTHIRKDQSSFEVCYFHFTTSQNVHRLPGKSFRALTSLA